MNEILMIRKGTDPTTAFKKGMRHIWDNLLYNSKNLKTTETLYIEIRRSF